MHMWNAIPDKRESLGRPIGAGSTINLHTARKPHPENTLIDWHAIYTRSEIPGRYRLAELVTRPQHARARQLFFFSFLFFLEHHRVLSPSISTLAWSYPRMATCSARRPTTARWDERHRGSPWDRPRSPCGAACTCKVCIMALMTMVYYPQS
ncbi:hypothetical protein BJY52DRAFT_1293100 [Lactarius psammicola]|nr:hypothetical protein BJY52DRAFT_1293100 [Lactarius psammicola]